MLNTKSGILIGKMRVGDVSCSRRGVDRTWLLLYSYVVFISPIDDYD